MAPYRIREYRESDRTQVRDVFSQGMEEYAPATFRHILKLPRVLVLLLGGVPRPLPGLWLLAARPRRQPQPPRRPEILLQIPLYQL